MSRNTGRKRDENGEPLSPELGSACDYPSETRLVCEECGEEKAADQFCDPTSSEPHCKECAAGFWEIMGDDPCGKGWAS